MKTLYGHRRRNDIAHLFDACVVKTQSEPATLGPCVECNAPVTEETADAEWKGRGELHADCAEAYWRRKVVEYEDDAYDRWKDDQACGVEL